MVIFMIKNRASYSRYIIVLLINFLILSILITSIEVEPYISNVITDISCLTICMFMVINYSIKYGFDMFDPIYFVSIIYFFLYFITPLYDIFIREYYWYGYELFPFGVKATLIAFVGYVCFYVFYRYKFIINRKPLKKNVVLSQNKDNCSNKKKLPYIYIMYVIAFVANVYYLKNSGFGNLKYILTLGLIGSSSDVTPMNNIGFISMLSYSLPTIVLLCWEYENSKVIKILLFIPMFILQVARGYRFFIIQIAVTFIAYYYLSQKKRPKIKNILILILVMLFFVIIMTIFRDAIRSGNGMDLSKLNLEGITKAFDEAFWGNFRIYQNFYGMVHVIPENFNYVGIRQIVIGTIVMMIPRAIWPGKISSYGGEGLRVLIGNNIAAGQAYPTLGEYYYAFGTLGVIIFMAIFGMWNRRLKYKYKNSNNKLDIIYFAVMLGCCLQLMIRGYFPSNFWYLLFAVLPIWIIKIIK